MNIFLICVGLYVVWTVVGIVYFICRLGQKNKKERWYEQLILLPVLPIAHFIGWLKNE